MTVRSRLAWPLTPEDLVENNVDIPDLVYNLLAWVLCGDSDDEVTYTVRPKAQTRHVDCSRSPALRFEWTSDDLSDSETFDGKLKAGRDIQRDTVTPYWTV